MTNNVFPAAILGLLCSFSPAFAQRWVRTGPPVRFGSAARYSSRYGGASVLRGDRNFTWYSITEGYTRAPQSGLPWNTRSTRAASGRREGSGSFEAYAISTRSRRRRAVSRFGDAQQAVVRRPTPPSPLRSVSDERQVRRSRGPSTSRGNVAR